MWAYILTIYQPKKKGENHGFFLGMWGLIPSGFGIPSSQGQAPFWLLFCHLYCLVRILWVRYVLRYHPQSLYFIMFDNYYRFPGFGFEWHPIPYLPGKRAYGSFLFVVWDRTILIMITGDNQDKQTLICISNMFNYFRDGDLPTTWIRNGPHLCHWICHCFQWDHVSHSLKRKNGTSNMLEIGVIWFSQFDMCTRFPIDPSPCARPLPMRGAWFCLWRLPHLLCGWVTKFSSCCGACCHLKSFYIYIYIFIWVFPVAWIP